MDPLSLLLVGGGAAAVSGSFNVGSTFLGNYLNRKNASRDNSRQLRNEALFDSWYLNNIYPKQQQLDYEMAAQYAKNSARWDVEGLKAAGLNPILAAKGGFSAGSDYSAPSMSSGPSGVETSSADSPRGVDIAESIRDAASADQALTDTEIKSDTKESLVSSAKSQAQLDKKEVEIADATKSKVQAEASQIKANTARTLVQAQNDMLSGGASSDLGRAVLMGARYIGDKFLPHKINAVDNALSNLFQSDKAFDTSSSAKQQALDGDLPPVIELINGSAKQQSDAEHQLLERQKLFQKLRKFFPDRPHD